MARKLPERRAEPRRWTGWISAATALALTGGLWLAGVLPQAQQILYDAAVSHASPGAMSEAVLVDIDAVAWQPLVETGPMTTMPH